jgi:DNA topoisomerase VI subunit B
LERNGYFEETFFTFSYSPIRDETGKVVGLFHPVTETTLAMLSHRRTNTLRDIVGKTGHSKITSEVISHAIAILSENKYDISFAAIYLLSEDSKTAHLAGHQGQFRGQNITPEHIVFSQSSDSTWPLDRIIRSQKTEVVDDIESRFGKIVCGEYPEAIQKCFMIPLKSVGLSAPIGFLIIAVSPRLPFDQTYKTFIEMLGESIATALNNSRAFEEENKRAAKLAEINKAKTIFFNNVSHEFRTPLTLMLAPIEEALTNSSKSLHGESLRFVYRNTTRLLKLVNTLLDFSIAEAGRSEARFQATNLADLTKDLASSFRSAVESAGLKYVVSADNLSELVVKDSGTGIPAHEIPNLFKRFHRVQYAKSRSHEGTGIGLALANDLSKLHGGFISAKSEAGVGTKFTVSVPLGAKYISPDQINTG